MKISELNSGDLVYWSGGGFWAWLIRFWTRPKFFSLKLAPFYHVGIVWRNGAGLFYADAGPTGVAIYNFAINPPSHAQRTHSAWTQETTDLLKRELHKPYSYKTAVLTPFKLAGRGSKAWMCSEFVVALMTQMGWDWKGYQPTPEGVRASLEALGHHVEDLE
jgi:hypothetical protein